MTEFLIRNAHAVLTGRGGTEARLAGPDIRVKNGRIAAIGQLAPEPGERVIDATDKVVYPAWVNGHHHLFQSLLKAVPAGINATLTPWLSAVPYSHRAAFDADLFRIAARIGLVELALSGCGTVADHNYIYAPGLGFDASAILFEEAEALGLRFILCRGGQTRARQIEADLPAALRPESADGYMADIARLVARYHDPAPDSFRRIVIAPTTPLHAVWPEELRMMAAEARRLKIRMHTHLSETVSYEDAAQHMHGMGAIRFCAEHGWIGEDVSFVHMVKLGQDEIELIGSTGSGIVHCPQSNGRLGSGIAPIVALAAAGACIGIGVDGAASNEAADMISETHAAWLMHRAKAGEAAVPEWRGGGGEADAAAAVTIEDVVHWGTSGGARLFGLEGVGEIALGMAADIAIYDLDQPRYFGLHDPAVGPVACAGSAKLTALFVGGRQIVAQGAIAGLDMAALAAQARDSVRRLAAGKAA